MLWTWLSVGMLVVCALTFYAAVEDAPGIRRGRVGAMATMAAAVVLFFVSGFMLLEYLPVRGFERFLSVAIAAVTGVTCLWFVKVHVDDRHYPSAAIATVMGLAMCATAFFIQFGDLAEARMQWAGAAVRQAANPTQRAQMQLTRLRQRQAELETRLLSGIPAFRRKLQADVTQIKRELAGNPSAQAQARLHDELTEVARLMLALDGETKQTDDLLGRVRQEQRRLDRLLSSQTNLVDDAALHAELDAVWQEAGTQLSRPLDERLGAGTIADSAVEKKVNELEQARDALP